MPLKQLAKWTIVEVEWEDIKCDSGTCESADFLKTYKPSIRRTLGYVIDQSPKYLVIAETDDRKGDVAAGDCERVNTIPVFNIINCCVLTRPEMPKPRKKTT